MKVAILHNRYRIVGGEDTVYEDEASALIKYGHTVLTYEVRNADVDDGTLLGKVSLAARTVWNHSAYRRLRQWFRQTKPDVAHFHNFMPLISPAGYYAARAEGVSVVQTLHNFRLVCPGAMLFRDSQTCEACVGMTVPWLGVRHACYRSSRQATAAVTAMLATHNLLGTWRRKVDLFIAPSEFVRSKFIQAGFPENRIVTKSNLVEPDLGYVPKKSGYFLFVGRLTREKGLLTLLEAWRRLPAGMILKIAGQGPLEAAVVEASRNMANVEYLGQRTRAEVAELMGLATAVVVPSESYETFGKVVVESYSRGTPVIAAALGALQEIVEDRNTGLLFSPGNAEDLADRVKWAASNLPSLEVMGTSARKVYEARYTSEINVRTAIGFYELARTHATRFQEDYRG